MIEPETASHANVGPDEKKVLEPVTMSQENHGHASYNGGEALRVRQEESLRERLRLEETPQEKIREERSRKASDDSPSSLDSGYESHVSWRKGRRIVREFEGIGTTDEAHEYMAWVPSDDEPPTHDYMISQMQLGLGMAGESSNQVGYPKIYA